MLNQQLLSSGKPQNTFGGITRRTMDSSSRSLQMVLVETRGLEKGKGSRESLWMTHSSQCLGMAGKKRNHGEEPRQTASLPLRGRQTASLPLRGSFVSLRGQLWLICLAWHLKLHNYLLGYIPARPLEGTCKHKGDTTPYLKRWWGGNRLAERRHPYY